MILTVPQDDALYPTLGAGVCDFIESNLVFGPGDLRGEPARLDDEKRALVYRMYEVFPQKHAMAGRRRFKRVALSVRKGWGKTEFAAWIAACELHPDAPVRCIGWKKGTPIGGPVTDPYIPMVAYTEEQSEDLAYGALRVILELSTVADDFDIGLERILRKRGGGKAVALASAPDARDGARTTFQHYDETHRFTLPRLVRAHQTMNANTSKRKGADPWSLETTTAPEPGAGSVAEATMEYARAVAAGTLSDSRLFFFHREASDEHDLTTDEGIRAAVIEASGPVAEWSDIESIVDQFRDPTTDKTYLERVWLNRLVQSSSQAFDTEKWKSAAAPRVVKPGALITIGFDGAMFHDSTALVCTDVETGYQWVAGLWECPLGGEKRIPRWQVPVDEVEAVIKGLFSTYTVWRMYADPPYWESYVAKWIGLYGKERVNEWWTNRRRPMRAALEGFHSALTEGSIPHDGHKDYARHLGNARKKELDGERDEQGRKYWLIQKERPDSPQKIDVAMAGVLSWEARTDAITAGANLVVESVYATRGVRSITDWA